MLFLSLILTPILTFSSARESNIQDFFTHYVHQVAKGEVEKKNYDSEFSSILEDDKVLFKSCAQTKCKVKTVVKKMKHNEKLWQLQAEVSYISGNETKSFEYRKGCYYLSKENKKWKLLSYIEDCQTR